MTWQRIDENTYIDDTLVTCAEYQLFINEMREQGKYHQPDHWTSYQFSEGHALEPILGVRYSDSQAFCKWLDQRETYDWKFRLPLLKETQEMVLKSTIQFQGGFWFKGNDQKSGFIFKNNGRGNVRHIFLDELLNRYPFLKKSKTIGSTLNLPVDIEYENNMGSGIIQNLRRGDFDQVLAVDMHIHRMLSRFFSNADERKLEIRTTSSNLIELIEILHNNRTPDLRNFILSINLNFDFVYESVCCLFADIFTLQERIAGRSPAFEGIRLVKECIR